MIRLAVLVFLLAQALGAAAGELKAGAAVVNVTPPKMPVIVNGGFTERQMRLIADPLFARALVLDDSEGTRFAIVVVDNCMIPRRLCDVTKARASAKTGIRADRILISATHTHSAPSVMDYCLGSRKDPHYTSFLPHKIVEAIEKANAALQPAKIGWGTADAGDYTKVRRWILRPDQVGTDPFGEKTIRANMHPPGGHQSPLAVGESGPVDPWLTVLSVQTVDGKPLAMLGNFSMHYFSGHAGLSADYFGHFCKILEARMKPDNASFVAMLSPGTSGDLWRRDYAQPKPEKGVKIEDYSKAIADLALKACESTKYHANPKLAMTEERITLERRTPTEKRLEWARGVVKAMGDRRPKTKEEVYAEQAIYLHDNPKAEVVLQALRIGDYGIATMPNEVYAITGLKLKRQSPLATTMVIELANGASGYIPPPEQHHLGGYNTWPARTAGLEVQAEPIMVSTLLRMLSDVASRPHRVYREPAVPHTTALEKLKPLRRWRFGDFDNASKLFEQGVAFHLPGVPFAGSEEYASRSAHFAGGRMISDIEELGGDYTVAVWFWNGLVTDAREVAGHVFSRGAHDDPDVPGDHLGIGGTKGPSARLFVDNDGKGKTRLSGKTEITRWKWHHVAFVRSGDNVRVYLDGKLELDGELKPTFGTSTKVHVGGRSDNHCNFEGRLDEGAVFARALKASEIAALYEEAGIQP